MTSCPLIAVLETLTSGYIHTCTLDSQIASCWVKFAACEMLTGWILFQPLADQQVLLTPALQSST